MGTETSKLQIETANTSTIVLASNSIVLEVANTSHNSRPFVIALPIRYADGRHKDIPRIILGITTNVGSLLNWIQVGNKLLFGFDFSLLVDEIVICRGLLNVF